MYYKGHDVPIPIGDDRTPHPCKGAKGVPSTRPHCYRSAASCQIVSNQTICESGGNKVK